MPIYRYRCQNCSIEFEKVQAFSEKSLTCCPECCKNTLQRVPQRPTIIFKGSGWYSMDRRSTTNTERSAGEKGKG
ncbi:MAG: FmdB family zinc ribbon protein [Chloroflexota bacterium]